MRRILVIAGLGAICGSTQGQNLLTNPGFESGLSGWTTFGNVFAEMSNPPQFVPQSGDGLVSMFGNFSGSFNVSGLFQMFPATPGSQWTLDGYSRHFGGDPMVGGGAPTSNWVVMKLAFKDSAGVEIGGVEATILDGTSPTDVWIDNSPLVGVAPAGTVQVEALFLYLQPGFDGGAAHIDSASLIPAPSAAGALVLGLLGLARRRR